VKDLMIDKRTRLLALNRQIQRLHRSIERLNQTSSRFSWLRMIVFVGGLLIGVAAYLVVGVWIALIALSVSACIFGILVYCHRQVDASISRHRIWLRIKSAQVARMELDWDRIPSTFGYRPQADHPFEADLDVVGRRSLYLLLDTAVSYEGSQRLRTWLTAPKPDPTQTLNRQKLARELAPRYMFRDRLIMCGTLAAGTHKTWDANQLLNWLEDQAPQRALWVWTYLLSGWVILNLVLFASNRLGLIGPIWLVSLIGYFGLVMARSQTTKVAFDEAVALHSALQQLSAVFQHLENHTYRGSPHLKKLCEPFLDRSQRPSQHLARVTRVVTALALRENPAAWFALNAVFPWDALVSLRLSQCKQQLSLRVPRWMDIWFELEALGSLANLAYLNPHYVFPEILVGEDHDAVFRTRHMGHPLIQDGEKIRNDFEISKLGQLRIITGSNMAGKTVFLKTVGLNLALANAGGPVDATSLQTLPFRLFTSIQVTDSVTDGISYFYAEVKRLKKLLSELESSDPLPLVFFIDEIFRGTNNRERLIGSRALVTQLVRKNGFGLIATHDLELTKLAAQLPEIRNYHFRDHVVDDRMTFDYILRTGPSPTTNALKIMQVEGLLPAQAMDD
jgi:hypothetical protein